jgi:hypothetical protein
MSVYSDLVKDIRIPRMAKVRQIFERPVLEDVVAEVRRQLSKDKIASTIKPGMRIAITGGSRGVTNIAVILREIAAICKEKGAEPFIIPAMGSHGGATAEGQLEVLESYGITEEFCGCSIISSLETTQIGFTPEGHPVFIDKHAAESDGIIVVNRIKGHTAFNGVYESGLMKMITIGLGKQKGAEVCHMAGFKHMHHLVPLFAKSIIRYAPIIFGLGIIENAYDETCKLAALLPDEIVSEEPKLLIEAKKLMGHLWFEETDVLVVDKLGKNISGDGADPNVTGAFLTPYAKGGIKAQRRAVLDLTDETHGNAAGIGVFDAITRRLFNRTSLEITYPNAVTNTMLLMVKIPIIMESDRDAIAVAIKSCNEIDYNNARVIRIRDTSHIDEIWVSENMLDEVRENPHMEQISDPEPLPFDEHGNLW